MTESQLEKISNGDIIDFKNPLVPIRVKARVTRTSRHTITAAADNETTIPLGIYMGKEYQQRPPSLIGEHTYELSKLIIEMYDIRKEDAKELTKDYKWTPSGWDLKQENQKAL